MPAPRGGGREETASLSSIHSLILFPGPLHAVCEVLMAACGNYTSGRETEKKKEPESVRIHFRLSSNEVIDVCENNPTSSQLQPGVSEI